MTASAPCKCSALPVPQGFLVAAVEHADGTASCTQLADGSYRLLEGLGSGAVLESKCVYRVTECLSMVKVLESLNEGKPSEFSLCLYTYSLHSSALHMLYTFVCML